MTAIPKQRSPKPCLCGSGKLRCPQYDARGIFLTYTCDDCHGAKMAGYRPDVLTDPDYWTDEPIEERLADPDRTFRMHQGCDRLRIAFEEQPTARQAASMVG